MYSALAAVALTAAILAPGASSATIYEHINYGGAALGGESLKTLGTMNDDASSLRTYGRTVTFTQDAYYGGSRLVAWADQSDLRKSRLPFSVFATWNDEISAWYAS
ncbi:hypothetical protein [Micrococcus porci]|uniref:hypothetical protein n=1 Tax=Micrococcus porci TaxID=2856555 RepID=UPI003CF4F3D9